MPNVYLGEHIGFEVHGRVHHAPTGAAVAHAAGVKRAGVALTPRERETLDSLAEGLSYKEVAHRHGVSSHTVAEHVKGIYKKLGVNSRGEAVFAAVSSGLLRLR